MQTPINPALHGTRYLRHPKELDGQVEKEWAAYLEAAQAANIEPPAHPETVGNIKRVWSLSEFVAQNCIRHPAMLPELLHSGDLLLAYPETFFREIYKALQPARDREDLERILREIRRREMTRIAWRDLSGWASLDETLRDLSLLAEHLLCAALERLYRWQCRELGAPWDEQRRHKQSLIVLAMGKLGAGELNFSSDIDLIFCYPEEGETRGRRPTLSNAEFFTRLGQDLINILSRHTDEGWVYRVDMRLRPYGNSGPLVMSFDALEEYYQSQGREWERYAMIKARPMGGDPEQGARLMERLRPFVYRRYIDFSALESLRDMKALINREVEKKELQDNIKTGPGGIREIEFIGQAFQLIRGGREPALRIRPIQQVLACLAREGHLPQAACQELQEAYGFLRRVENRLQEWADEQTHQLPTDTPGRARLAFAMGFHDWPGFLKCLNHHRQRVHGHFEQVFEAPQLEGGASATPDHPPMARVWLGGADDKAAILTLEKAGFADPGEALRRIRALQGCHACRALSARGRQRLDQLMPLLLRAVSLSHLPDTTLARVLDLIEAIARRTAYLALLNENPMVLSQLVRLCAASPWISDTLTRHPVLLDELVDPRTLYSPLDREELRHELETLLARVPPRDQEQQLDTLRYFKQINMLRVAAADVTDILPLMVVSDHLTGIAEVILREVLALARQQLRERKKSPTSHGDGRFGIIGYGKLGGIEMSYGSDLDLVFLHNARNAAEQAYFARLGQRVIHILSTHTPGGVLYEVDMRLRPSGASGLLVSPLEAFSRYQEEEAWTWEHQALVRARFVAGDPFIRQCFDETRARVLRLPRNPGELRREVRDMRQRMREELSRPRPGRFDIKHDTGGLADIEFLVQFGVLRWAHDHPELTTYTDNIRLLADFGRLGLMPEKEACLLSQAYQDYRKTIHRLVLQELPAIVDEKQFREERRLVGAAWKRLLGDYSDHDPCRPAR